MTVCSVGIPNARTHGARALKASALARPLNEATSPADVVEIVGAALDERLGVQDQRILVWCDDDALMWRPPAITPVTLEAAPSGVVLRVLNTEVRTVIAFDAARGDTDLAGALGMVDGCLVPVAVSEQAVAAMAFTLPSGVSAPAPADIEFLDTLAALTAGAIDRVLAGRARRVALEARDAEAAAHARAREELQAARALLVERDHLAALGELLTSVAHDMGTPVAVVTANARAIAEAVELLRDCPADDPTARRCLDRMSAHAATLARGADRIDALARDLKASVRPPGLPAAPTPVREALDLALRLLHHRWDGRIDVRCSYGDSAPVAADPSHMHRVAMNLLANACDAIPAEGRIDIRTVGCNEGVLVEIADDGIGIPAEHLPHVFEPSFTTKDAGRGTGLGLAITRRIVERYGGRIDVESRVGRGTTFRLLLPTRVDG